MSLHLYLGVPECGKSTLMREHVYASTADVLAFFIIAQNELWHGPRFRTADDVRRLDRIPRYVVLPTSQRLQAMRLAIALGHCVYVDEEAHRAAGVAPWPRASSKLGEHPLFDIAHEGRHLLTELGEEAPVSAMLATHRPANLPGDVLACAKTVYIGRVQAYDDALALYRNGMIPEACSPREARAILDARKPGEFSVYQGP